MSDHQAFEHTAHTADRAEREKENDRDFSERRAWKVLIVDDDAAVHQVTKMVMSGFQFDGKPVEFISAYSGEEACRLVADIDDLALILLDVVMETDHAGLEAARYIRQELNNHTTRIVLRTGQPGQAPEDDVIRNYDINDYKDKTELTKTKLVTLFYSALRSYRDIAASRIVKDSRQTKPYGTEPLLVDQDALAAVGSMVSGVTHEVSTPLGVCVSSISYIQDALADLQQQLESQTLTDESLATFIGSCSDAADLTLNNLQRASALVRSFKAVATNQSVVAVRCFDLKELLIDVLRSLYHETRRKVPEVLIECPDNIKLHSDAGALTQIISNLVINSLRHGFADQGLSAANKITITAELRPNGLFLNEVLLRYSDSGSGILGDVVPHIFEPFFTTKRDDGGTGIGLSVVKELAEQRLKGHVHFITGSPKAVTGSQKEMRGSQGACFELSIPQDIREQTV